MLLRSSLHRLYDEGKKDGKHRAADEPVLCKSPPFASEDVHHRICLGGWASYSEANLRMLLRSVPPPHLLDRSKAVLVLLHCEKAKMT